MANAIQELSNAPDGKYLINLSHTICDFLLSYYKDDGNQALIFLLIVHLFIYNLIGRSLFLMEEENISNGNPLKAVVS